MEWLRRGQIIDATIVSAPKQRNTDGEKADISMPAGFPRLGRTSRPSSRIDIAAPSFGYKNHIGIDKRHGLIAPGRRPMQRVMTECNCPT